MTDNSGAGGETKGIAMDKPALTERELLTEIRNDIHAMRQSLSDMTTKMAVMDHQTETSKKDILDLEHRVRELEATKWKMYGMAAALSTVIGLMTQMLQHVLPPQ